MRTDTIAVMQEARKAGLNAVGCKVKNYANWQRFTLFLKEDRENKELLNIAKNAGFPLIFDFIEDYGYTYKHGANKLLSVAGLPK